MKSELVCNLEKEIADKYNRKGPYIGEIDSEGQAFGYGIYRFAKLRYEGTFYKDKNHGIG